MTGEPNDIIVKALIDLMLDRDAKGVLKYGVTTFDNPLSLRQWLQHALEETLDHAVYLRRAMEEIDRHVDFCAVNPLEAILDRRTRAAVHVEAMLRAAAKEGGPVDLLGMAQILGCGLEEA